MEKRLLSLPDEFESQDFAIFERLARDGTFAFAHKTPLEGKWLEAGMFAPPEIILRYRKAIDFALTLKEKGRGNRRFLDDQVDLFNERVDQLTGGSEEDERVIYENFDYSGYWYNRGIGPLDKAVAKGEIIDVSNRLGLPVWKLNISDGGTGGRMRIPEMLIDAVEGLLGSQEKDRILDFKKRIYACDNVASVIGQARASGARLGIPLENIMVADLLDPLFARRFKGHFHVKFNMMHTVCHFKEEEKMATFLWNEAESLALGGVSIADLVPLDNGILIGKAAGNWMQFYRLLHEKYCDEMQPVIDSIGANCGISPPKILGLSRHFIRDFTAGGQKSFVREMPSFQWINAICKSRKIPLKVRKASLFKESLMPDNDETFRLGDQLIRQNGLFERVMEKVNSRLSGLRADHLTDFADNLRSEAYRMVAMNMILNYPNQYLVMKRV